MNSDNHAIQSRGSIMIQSRGSIISAVASFLVLIKILVGMRGLPPLRSVLSLVPRSGRRTGSHPPVKNLRGPVGFSIVLEGSRDERITSTTVGALARSS